jgi:hypothetical protein
LKTIILSAAALAACATSCLAQAAPTSQSPENATTPITQSPSVIGTNRTSQDSTRQGGAAPGGMPTPENKETAGGERLGNGLTVDLAGQEPGGAPAATQGWDNGNAASSVEQPSKGTINGGGFMADPYSQDTVSDNRLSQAFSLPGGEAQWLFVTTTPTQPPRCDSSKADCGIQMRLPRDRVCIVRFAADPSHPSEPSRNGGYFQVRKNDVWSCATQWSPWRYFYAQ